MFSKSTTHALWGSPKLKKLRRGCVFLKDMRCKDKVGVEGVTLPKTSIGSKAYGGLDVDTSSLRQVMLCGIAWMKCAMRGPCKEAKARQSNDGALVCDVCKGTSLADEKQAWLTRKQAWHARVSFAMDNVGTLCAVLVVQCVACFHEDKVFSLRWHILKDPGRLVDSCFENKLGLGSKQAWREFETSLVCRGKQAWQIKNKLGLRANGLGWEIETSLVMKSKQVWHCGKIGLVAEEFGCISSNNWWATFILEMLLEKAGQTRVFGVGHRRKFIGDFSSVTEGMVAMFLHLGCLLLPV
ncbi:hypothetical protein QYF36_008404 [Acer negundo]|nr:hypothetical protein QYF36_008404 [Acer negundo]